MSRAERVLSTGAVPLDPIQRERIRIVICSIQERLGYRLPPIEQFPTGRREAVEEIWLERAMGIIRKDKRRLSGPFGLFRHRHFPDLRQLELDELLILRRLEELVPGGYSND